MSKSEIMLTKSFVLVLIVLLLCNLLCGQGAIGNRKAAVLTIITFDAEEFTADIVAEKIRTRLQQVGVEVMEREAMEKILKKKKIKISDCLEPKCMVEAGRILSVDQIVGGSITLSGDKYIINIKLVDVASGLILADISKECGSNIAQLNFGVEYIAQRLITAISTAPSNIALFDFNASGIEADEAQIISERIRLELKNTQRFNVLEREKMHQILTQQAFQKSGCPEIECLLEAGKLLSVDKMVGGSISKVGDHYVIEARFVDLPKGNITGKVTEEFDGPIELLLQSVPKRVARRLAGLPVE